MHSTVLRLIENTCSTDLVLVLLNKMDPSKMEPMKVLEDHLDKASDSEKLCYVKYMVLILERHFDGMATCSFMNIEPFLVRIVRLTSYFIGVKTEAVKKLAKQCAQRGHASDRATYTTAHIVISIRVGASGIWWRYIAKSCRQMRRSCPRHAWTCVGPSVRVRSRK